MSTDTIKGAVKEKLGHAQRKVGQAIGDDETEAKGAAKEVTGNLQKNFGKLKDKINQ